MDMSVKFILTSLSHLFILQFGITHCCQQGEIVFSPIINLAKETKLLSKEIPSSGQIQECYSWRWSNL